MNFLHFVSSMRNIKPEMRFVDVELPFYAMVKKKKNLDFLEIDTGNMIFQSLNLISEDTSCE